MKHVSVLLIVILAAIFLPVPWAHGQTSPQPGDFIVNEYNTHTLSWITTVGARTPLFTHVGSPGLQTVAIDLAGNYIEVEAFNDVLSLITPGGSRSVIFNFASGTFPDGAVIDSAGNYIVSEYGTRVLSKVTNDGLSRTPIYSFAGTAPLCAVVDSNGDYIVLEQNPTDGSGALSRIATGPVRTVIHTFSANTLSFAGCLVINSAGNFVVAEGGYPTSDTLSEITLGGGYSVIYNFPAGTAITDVALDASGNYIVTECGANVLSMVTPGHVRSVIYTFATHTCPIASAVVPNAAQSTQRLMSLVNSMNLPGGASNSLTSKLSNALSSLNSGNYNAAKNKLNAFVNEVNAKCCNSPGKPLTQSQSNQLNAAAKAIKNAIP